MLDEVNDTVDGIWKKLKESITVVAEKICGVGRQEKKPPWITIDIMLKMEERRKLKLENKRVEYKLLYKDIKQSCRKAREKYYEDKCKELEELDAKHSPKFFTKIKEIRRKKNYAKSGLRNKEGQIIQDGEGIVRRWYEYIAELYNDDRGDVAEIFTEEVVDLKPCIPETEILDAIKQLPKGKAVGEDNVPVEFSQNVGEKGKRMIAKLINKIYQTRITSWLYIIKNRITKIINEHLEESQFGFREGTRNAIYVLRTIGERMMQKKKKVYICFIDYAKAFDNVKHGKLIQIMKTGWNPKRMKLKLSLIYTSDKLQEFSVMLDSPLSLKSEKE